MRSKFALAIALCVFLTGCSQAALVKMFTRPEDESTVRNYVDLLRRGDFDRIVGDLDPSLVTPDVRQTLAQMSALFPPESPQFVKVVGASIGTSNAALTLEYQFPSKWLTARVSIRRKDGLSTITDFHVTELPDSLEHHNRFTLAGKSAIQYSVLSLGICSFAFSVFVLALCIRTKGLKRKWLWVLFILAGVDRAAINWTTGQLTYSVLGIYLPCIQVSRDPYGPWTVGVLFPLGAVVFLVRHRKIKLAGQVAPVTTPN